MARPPVKPPATPPVKPATKPAVRTRRTPPIGTIPPIRQASNPTRHDAQKAENGLIMSYQALQQLLGWLGMALPVLLLAYAVFAVTGLEPSISDFYYTAMGDVLVGILCAIGVFLLCYRGYQPLPGQWLSDRHVSLVAGFAALGVALFPVRRTGQPSCNLYEPTCVTFGWSAHPDWFHYGPAAVFFICLALFCIILFTRGDCTAAGRIIWTRRNIFYVACGGVIVLSILAMLPYMMGNAQTRDLLAGYHYLFWWETAGIVAFALSWLRKGKAMDTVVTVMRRVKG